MSVYPWGNAYYATAACGKGPYSSDERHCWFKRCVEPPDAPSDCFTAGNIVTQHAEPEKSVNFIEACAIKLNPDWKTYWPFIQCMEEEYSSRAMKTCASRAGLDDNAIAKCTAGSDGETVEKEMAKATPDHPGVPYILVNGKAINDPSGLLKAVCDAYTGAKPAGCNATDLSIQQDYKIEILV